MVPARTFTSPAGTSPRVRLTRNPASVRLRDLLAEVATRANVLVLLWAGAPGRLFKPGRAAVRTVRAS